MTTKNHQDTCPQRTLRVRKCFVIGSLWGLRPHAGIDGIVRKSTTFTALGIHGDGGQRRSLAVRRVLSGAEARGREFLISFKERRIGIPDLIVSDTHNGLKAACQSALRAGSWQRRQFPLQQNAGRYVTKQELKSGVASWIAWVIHLVFRPRASGRLHLFLDTWREKQPPLTAVLIERSDTWESGKSCPKPTTKKPRFLASDENSLNNFTEKALCSPKRDGTHSGNL